MRVLNEGTRLADRYSLVRRLGAGGMSQIWLATDRQADSRVALKFLADALCGDPRQRELFHTEWRTGSRLMHPHIVRVFEYHDEDDGPYYSLQYIDGPEISVLCGQDAEASMRPIGLVADALRYAHGKGIVHRDIKASNILLDGRGAPYLIDFGVARNTGDGAGAGGGSPIASSPQQRAGEPAAPADDVYALGVVIGELLRGSPPEGPPPVDLTAADGRQAPAALQSLVNDMLSADAARRPDAEQVTSALDAAGFAAAAAPAALVGATPAPLGEPEQVSVESIRPVHLAKATPQPARTEQRPGGVSPAVLYGGLGGLLALVLAVIFVLPRAFDGERPGAATEEDVIEEVSDAPDAEAGTVAGSDADDDLLLDLPPQAADGDNVGFSENIEAVGTDQAARLRFATDEALGDLLSRLERLRYRAVDRWGGQPFLDALDVYQAGDRAYLAKNYRVALQRYREAIELLDPFFDQVEKVFADTLAEAHTAFERADHLEAVRLYDLAVAITPGNVEAERGLKRALNLEEVMSLTDQGYQFEEDLELDAARLAFEKALELDPAWEPASVGLERVRASIKRMSFDQRMTEGLDALASGDLASATAAFKAARVLDPQSRQPLDGLMQVDQESRLSRIRRLERQAATLEQNEEWESLIGVYEDILEIDADLQFAKEGLVLAKSRSALHRRLEAFIGDPDSLSLPATMQNATTLLLQVTRISPIGPRLEDQKNELSRLLKRAATPLTVRFVSDNATEVAIYKVGRLGMFSTQDLSLRPGAYVAVGSRPGFRDVRLEFRVAPEIEMRPIVIQCEERI